VTLFDFRDFFILAHVNAAGIVGTVYLFLHPTPEVFAAWCGLIATLVGCYHWFVVRDQKIPDAGG
jgi:hypothetical protein